MVFSRLAPEPLSRHAARRLHSLLPLFAKNMQSSNTAGFMSSVLSSMSSLDAMAQLLSESQLIPDAHRNKADCFTACLMAMKTDQSPWEILKATEKDSSHPDKAAGQTNSFNRLVLALTSAENHAQLKQAERLMDDLSKVAPLAEDESNAVLTIYRDRCRSICEMSKKESLSA